MKFIKNYASDWNHKEEIEIKNLKELMKLVIEEGSDIILSAPDKWSQTDKWTIIIYDDYLE